MGGISLAAAASLASGKPFVIVRNKKKDYGTSKPIEGIIQSGDVVLLVEDIATTGGQVLEAAEALREAGATVERIVATAIAKLRARNRAHAVAKAVSLKVIDVRAD